MNQTTNPEPAASFRCPECRHLNTDGDSECAQCGFDIVRDTDYCDGCGAYKVGADCGGGCSDCKEA